MNGLAIRPTTHRRHSPRHDARRPALLVELTALFDHRSELVGARGRRLARAMRAGLPVPAGTIVTASALVCFDPRADNDNAADAPSSAEVLHDAFATISQQGRRPLMVSVSSISSPRSDADRIVASRDVTTGAELLHAVHRLSATASLLGDTIAVVIQVDATPTNSGTLTSSKRRTAVASSIHAAGPEVDVARLVDLGQRVAGVFDGDRRVEWVTDSHDRLWILDVGPELGAA